MEKNGKKELKNSNQKYPDYAKIAIKILVSIFIITTIPAIVLTSFNLMTEALMLFLSNAATNSLTTLFFILRKRSDDTDPQVLAGIDKPYLGQNQNNYQNNENYYSLPNDEYIPDDISYNEKNYDEIAQERFENEGLY